MNTRKLNMAIDRIEMYNCKQRNKIRRNKFYIRIRKVALGFIAIGFIILMMVNFIGSKIVSEVKAEELPIQIQSVNTEVVPIKIGGSDQQQEYVQYAWKISGNKINFLYMLNGENGNWNMYTQSNVRYPGTDIREESWGFCQVHKPSHPDKYMNPLFMTDWKHQIDTCYQMWDKNPNQFNATKNTYLMATAREQIKLISK